MDFFERFVSCTTAGSGNQNRAALEPGRVYRGRIYFRLSRDTDTCALLYSNRQDSTYGDGSLSRAEQALLPWRIHALRAGLLSGGTGEDAPEPEAFTEVLFDGERERPVRPGELFYTDPFPLKAQKGDTVCVEMAFSGEWVPCHTESLLPAFRLGQAGWTPCTELPFPSMLGSPRGGERRLGLLGDSITQGIGTAFNSYTHLASRLQEALGPGCAVWNLGLGYGRAADAALDGGWLYKAKQNDLVCVCFGVNDLLQTGDGEKLEKDLAGIVEKLRGAGVRVVLETVPPFDWEGPLRDKWLKVNAFVRNWGAQHADAVFDTVPSLGLSEDEPWRSRFGAHPDGRGNALWAEGLAPLLLGFLGDPGQGKVRVYS